VKLQSKLLAAALCLATASAAQNTWIVDAGASPAAHFTDLPQAVAAAQDGDTLLVRPGRYSQTTIDNKELKVLGDPTAHVYGLEVKNLAAGKSVALVDLTTSVFLGGVMQFRFVNCNGRVHAQRLSCVVLMAVQDVPGIYVDNCAGVTLLNCDSQGAPGLFVRKSDVSVTGGRLHGTAAWLSYDPQKPAEPVGHASRAGVEAVDARVLLSQVAIQGGHSTSAGGIPPFQAKPLDPSPGIEVDATTLLVIAGDARTKIEAGADSYPTKTAVAAILGAGGPMLLDSAVQLNPANGASGHSGFGAVTSSLIPAIIAAEGRGPGSRWTYVLRAAQGDMTLALLGAPSTPVVLGALGQLWLDASSFFVLGPLTVTSSAGELQLGLDVPADPSLRALQLGLQCFVWRCAPSGCQESISTPGIVIIE
jgi:hypothetical protein